MEKAMFSIVLGLFVLGIVVFLISSKNKKAKQLREAEAEYKVALTALQ
jgi:cbb3-type cytochrome oxidase subunit 3